MYMDRRTTSAFQSLARTLSDPSVTHCENHWMPWVLMPRSWTASPRALHSCRPQTLSWPLRATGVPVGGLVVTGGVVGGRVVGAVVGGRVVGAVVVGAVVGVVP